MLITLRFHACYFLDYPCKSFSLRINFTDTSTARPKPGDDLQEPRVLQSLQRSGWWKGEYVYNSSYCKWPGITCNHAGHVIEIMIISPEDCDRNGELVLQNRTLAKLNFSCLPDLLRLHMRGTRLLGIIPEHIGTLLFRSSTHLTSARIILLGQLPLSLANLSQLVGLSLSFNQLSGFIPQELGSKWKNLVLLDMRSNHFQGPIPLSFLSLTNLRYLLHCNNMINGSIPVGIGNLKNLKTLSLFENNLIGPLPSSLFQLKKL
ncbi:LOW QUALITY PROTEIN: LRR domain containing protein [Parasponia andersonii]|uniref:LRR domain containing protein n=1 Tax=Parasponia andersonii TaxID=3476 RepID=A0A2P5BCV7_PARAD|nr:LOW QUALITY PROTEIN: LRR domain containing protein [Parasponia andersonii]